MSGNFGDLELAPVCVLTLCPRPGSIFSNFSVFAEVLDLSEVRATMTSGGSGKGGGREQPRALPRLEPLPPLTNLEVKSEDSEAQAPPAGLHSRPVLERLRQSNRGRVGALQPASRLRHLLGRGMMSDAIDAIPLIKTVVFIGEYFTVTTSVQPLEELRYDAESDDELAIRLAGELLHELYGWDVPAAAKEIGVYDD